MSRNPLVFDLVICCAFLIFKLADATSATCNGWCVGINVSHSFYYLGDAQEVASRVEGGRPAVRQE